ncbi:hypothetical protein BGZ46_004081 [Entomortierella lignicola]|nr:hypothetical protein BGZ46_004081 [Entomortierella lignicola]
MSSLYNRIYQDGLGLLGPQSQHRIRSKRLTGHKHQIYRRNTLTAADILYTLTGNNNKHSDSPLKTVTSLCSSSSSSSQRSTFLKSTLASALKHQRTDMLSNEPEFSSRFLARQLLSSSISEDVSSLAQAHVGIESNVAFTTGYYSQQLHPHQQELEFACFPLPPLVLRVGLPGSPLSPFPPTNNNNYNNNNGLQGLIARSAHLVGGNVRTMGAGGRSIACGGGRRDGDKPVPSGGANDSTDGESDVGKPVPSAYTFRRRNAIVEGLDEAPKVDEYFSDSA